MDPAEAVSLVLNYITAYQMLHRSAKIRADQRGLIHGAAAGDRYRPAAVGASRVVMPEA